MCDIPPASHPVFSFFSLHTPNSMHIIPPLECLPKTWTCQPLCAAVDGSFGVYTYISYGNIESRWHHMCALRPFAVLQYQIGASHILLNLLITSE